MVRHLKILRHAFAYGAMLIALWMVPVVLRADIQGAELRIVDRTGLARLVAQVEGPQVVEVRLAAPSSDALILVHVDGLSPNVRAESHGPAVVRFIRVPPGTWKLIEKSAGGSEGPSAPKVQEVKLIAPGR